MISRLPSMNRKRREPLKIAKTSAKMARNPEFLARCSRAGLMILSDDVAAGRF
jgi:hypothetical protein